jgi:hypothetical protein
VNNPPEKAVTKYSIGKKSGFPEGEDKNGSVSVAD